MAKHQIKILRVYELGPETEGCRVLVDRLWPRGLSKERLKPDLWAKALAPSTELRKWFGHMAERFDRFALAYRGELDASPEAAACAAQLAERLKKQDLLLLYAAKNPDCNHALVLRDWLLEKMSGARPGA